MIESDAYSEICKHLGWSFVKLVTGFKKITIFKRNSVLKIFDIQDSEYASVNIFQLYPKSTFYC